MEILVTVVILAAVVALVVSRVFGKFENVHLTFLTRNFYLFNTDNQGKGNNLAIRSVRDMIE